MWVCVLLPPFFFFFLFLVFLFSLSPLSSSPFHEIPCTSFKTGHVTCAKSGQFVSFCTQLSTEAVHAGIRTPFVTCTTTTLLVRDGWSAFSKDQILLWQKNSLKMAFLVVLSHCWKINQKVAQVKIPPVDFDHFSRQQKNICFGVKIQMRHFGGNFLKLVMIVERIFSHEWVINYSFSPTRRGTQRPRKRTTSVVTKGFSVHFDPSPSSSILLQYITAATMAGRQRLD